MTHTLFQTFKYSLVKIDDKKSEAELDSELGFSSTLSIPVRRAIQSETIFQKVGDKQVVRV